MNFKKLFHTNMGILIFAVIPGIITYLTAMFVDFKNIAIILNDYFYQHRPLLMFLIVFISVLMILKIRLIIIQKINNIHEEHKRKLLILKRCTEERHNVLITHLEGYFEGNNNEHSTIIDTINTTSKTIMDNIKNKETEKVPIAKKKVGENKIITNYGEKINNDLQKIEDECDNEFKNWKE